MENNAAASAEDDDDGNEAALALANIECYNCHKKGHRAAQCKKPKSGGHGNSRQRRKPSFTGTCNNCGKVGHKVVDCWDLEANKSKRPKNWQSKSESGNTAGDTEYLLLCSDLWSD